MPTETTATTTTGTARPGSRADEAMRHVLRIPADRPPLDESSTHRIFSVSILLSATRCLLSYLVLPILLPLAGLAKGVGPVISIPVGVLALVFDYRGIRRFWLADHHRKWAFTALYAVVGTMVFALVVSDVVRLAH